MGNYSLTYASNLRLRYVELKMDIPEVITSLSEKGKKEMKDVLSCYSFKYLFHAPYINLNLVEVMKIVRDRAREKGYRATIAPGLVKLTLRRLKKT